jgi:hypothetical protein
MIANNRLASWYTTQIIARASTISMYLALIETSANQQFIFSTNKLRENIGASELTYIAGSQWVIEAVMHINGKPVNDQTMFESSSRIRDWLLDPTQNRPILLNPESSVKIEIILATSGKALFLAKDHKDAQKVISNVTQRALVEAPGLDICGVISEFNVDEDSIGIINSLLHKNFESVRSNRPGPESRFLRLPIIAECATSGMPASKAIRVSERKIDSISTISDTKRGKRNQGFDRIQKLLKRRNVDWDFAFSKIDPDSDSNFEEDQKLDWVAIIHADGNGLGQIFLDFGRNLSNSAYIEQYRQFSCAIDICTEEAFLDAIERVFPNHQQIPMRPLILGGDDLTVVCAGRFALHFTYEFLRSFEDRTSREIEGFVTPDIILRQAKEHLAAARLSACAGVAIVKRHFPFSMAYHLAEDLIKSAKTVKEIVKNKDGRTIPCSAIDYHMLYDSSGVDLESIRDKLHINHPPSKLYGRPYVVSPLDWYADTPRTQWIDWHHWQRLVLKADALIATDHEDRYVLPNSQMHDLREGLFLGYKGADSRYQRIRHRYPGKIEALDGDEGSLFWSEPESLSDAQSPNIKTTALLDAMDAANFWGEDK